MDIEPQTPEKKAAYDIDTSELEERAKTAFRAYRIEIYRILPNDCLLKPHGGLHPQMLAFDSRLLRRKWIYRQDICSLCALTACPWHDDVSHRILRGLKIIFLQKIFRRSFLRRVFKNSSS